MKQRKLMAILAVVLVLVLTVGVFAACDKTEKPNGPSAPATYTVLDSFITSPTTWNPHQSRTNDDTYVADYTTSGLYEFFFNADKTGYEIWPVMAASEPVDVTATLKADAKWEIPADATKGYAYTIALNPNAKWDDGTPINADTYVKSMELLLRPQLQNYRASNYFSGNMIIKNAENYFRSSSPIFNPVVPAYGSDETPDYSFDIEANQVYINLETTGMTFAGYSFEQMKNTYGYIRDAKDKDGNVVAPGATYYNELAKTADGYGYIAVTEDNMDKVLLLMDQFCSAFSASIYNKDKTVNMEFYKEFLFYNTGEVTEAFDFANVGIYKSGEYEITLVLEKSLTGFYLLYNLAGNWIVNTELYEECLYQDSLGIWKNSYDTDVMAGTACGPYKLTTYQEGKLMVFDRNTNWFGYSDPRFEGMYQATGIRSTNVKEASTRKQMFLKGELDSYGLQSEDYADYRTSDYFYTSPGTTIFFLVLHSNEANLKTAEKDGVDKEIIANDAFREALSLCFDKDAFAATISPARSGAYSVVGAYDIWNPTTGEKYRDTEIAKTALAEYYGFTKQANGMWKSAGDDVTEYTLDEAVDAITGYNVEAARDLFTQAYNEQLAAGKISATDKVEIEFALSETSTFIDKTVAYLNEQIAIATTGTPLEGKVSITKSSPQGNNWSTSLREGKSQTQLCGWNGGMLDPFNSMLYYTYPEYDPYAEAWWDTTTETLTLTLPVGEGGADVTLTMTLEDWGLCLNGDQIEIAGAGADGEIGTEDDTLASYNFGYEQVADNVRLTILAELEKAILGTNYYIPMLQDGSGFLLTQKVNYALGPDDYNAVLGRGGIAYMTFNYTDAEWEAYVASQGGTLTY